MTHVYLRSTGVYEYRRLIPAKLRPAFGRKRWRIESLGTKDKAEAKRKGSAVDVRVIAEFEAAETALMEGTAERWFETEFPRSKREFTRDLERWHFNADHFDSRRVLTPGEYHMMVDPIDSDADLRERLVYFVKQQGMAVGPETPEFERLMEAARAVYREYYPLPSPPPDMAVPAPVAQPRLFKPLTMDQLIRGWAKDTAPEEKTIYAWPKIMAKLTAHVGHDDITRITDTDVVSWKETLLASGLSRRTAANHLTIANTLFNWAERNKKIALNPARGISIKIKKKSGRRGFTDDEAQRILAAARAEKEAHKRWVPWLVCFTGTRLEEVCGAAVSDIRTIRGVPCLHIRLENRDERAGLKLDEASERIIPLHSAIVAEGFLAYVEKLPKDGPLFPDIKPDRFGRRGGNGSKTLGRWVRDTVGIDDDRIAPNHSWRHRFKTLCRNSGMREDLEEYLTSHSEGTTGRRYGEYQVEALANAIEMIKSPVSCETVI